MGTDLCGRHALVTGGGRGIGRAIAARLTAAGARVSIIGRDPATLAEAEASGDAWASASVDVTDETATRDAIARLAAKAPFDIVIANAGWAETATFERSDSALFRRMLDVNFMGVVTSFQAALPGMKERGFGRLIAIASTAGLRGYPAVSAYGAAKHAVIGLVRALALEYATAGITANAICPGYTDTDLIRNGAEAIASKRGISLEEAKNRFAQDNPMKRLIAPEEVAESVAWLCSATAASVSGQAIAINGGEF
jgi:NAD(P)-dependent dehydrogenase (short-subunit alcohol dehydrogenase family)